MKSKPDLVKKIQSPTLARAKSEISNAKLLATIEALRSKFQNEIQALQNEMHTLVTSRNQQDERQKQLYYEIHQMGEQLQKLEQANQYTQRLLQEQEKELGHNQQGLNQIEKDVQRLKALLRVD